MPFLKDGELLDGKQGTRLGRCRHQVDVGCCLQLVHCSGRGGDNVVATQLPHLGLIRDLVRHLPVGCVR